jgi:hypothetical protein
VIVWVTVAAAHPPLRATTHPISQTTATWTAAIARASPAASPRTRTGSATMSNNSGPGWLSSMPELTDADDAVPRSG